MLPIAKAMSKKLKIRYMDGSSILIGGYVVLLLIVSIRLIESGSLSLGAKLGIGVVLWGLVIYFLILLVRYYKKLDNSS